jgi:hypothetical protein
MLVSNSVVVVVVVVIVVLIASKIGSQQQRERKPAASSSRARAQHEQSVRIECPDDVIYTPVGHLCLCGAFVGVPLPFLIETFWKSKNRITRREKKFNGYPRY